MRYIACLEKLLPRRLSGGVIRADNINLRRADSKFMEAITTNPNFETFVHGGISITFKKGERASPMLADESRSAQVGRPVPVAGATCVSVAKPYGTCGVEQVLRAFSAFRATRTGWPNSCLPRIAGLPVPYS